ncbi:MAG: RnfABCDGE type electron transport complex subunit D [Candidatus Omnitrophota bacterium]|nr:RnfABCDGE type electron transport complex subunit D [Candidatus Omnitrophota bacterium]
MKFLRRLLDDLGNRLERNKFLKKIKPIWLASDEFFFGTDKVARPIPHIVDYIDIKRYMSFVVIALLPVVIASIYFWGLRVISIILVSYIFGGITEVIFAIVRKKEIHEGFLVTGLIFPLILPPTVPLWVVAVGVVFGVMFGKEMFGGTGRNIFNPAIVGRIFLTVAFPNIMTSNWQAPFSQGLGGLVKFSADAITSATPLALFKNEKITTDILSMFLGGVPGCIGETFRLGIIIGGIFLILTKISNWRLPLSYLIFLAIFSVLGNHFVSEKIALPLSQILSGGFLFGACFMVTDPVTSPFTKAGKWIAGLLLGLTTVLIRGLSGYVEGVMFSILLVNALAPLIDRIILDLKYKRIVR